MVWYSTSENNIKWIFFFWIQGHKNNNMRLLVLSLVIGTLWEVSSTSLPTCIPMGEIYANGKDLCETIYSNAYRYVPVGDPEYNLSYTMWWFTAANPNDATTAARLQAGLINQTQYPNLINQCYLSSPGVTFMKDFPSTNNGSMSECVPFRQNACCKPAIVANDNDLDNEYGASYRWDNCGPVSPQCERFFVQEDCMYECDPNAGLYRLYPPATVNASGN